MKTRIYFPIEIHRREFLSRIVFALKGSNKKTSVVIGSKEEIYSKINFLRPGHYILKSVQHGLIDLVKGLKKQKFKISAIDEEGLMHYDDQYYLRRLGKNVINEIDTFFFCWGAKDKSLIEKNFPEISSKLLISGNTRINILKEKYQSIYKDEISKIKSKYGEFFLVSTKFGKINFLPRKGYNEYVQGQVDRGYIKNNYSLDIAKQAKKHEKKNFELYLKFFENFSKKLPNKKLVILPHPGENYETYKKILKNFKNIQISLGEFSTESLLLATQCNISCNCTTSVESFFLKKMPINFIPFSNENVEYSLPKLVSKNENDTDNLISFLANFNEEKMNKFFFKNVNLDEVQNNISNEEAEEFMISKLGEYQVKKNKLIENFLFRSFYFMKRFIRDNLAIFNSTSDPLKKLKDQKNPKITKKQLIEISEQLSKIIKVDKPIITELFPGIFEFKNKSK